MSAFTIWPAVRIAAALAFLLPVLGAAQAQAPSRLALVIGNAAYQGAPPLRTTLADAALVAETMRAAGYAVTELRDVGADSIGEAVGAFLDQVEAAGPEAVAFFYFAGYAVQSGGDNFLVPVDADIRSDEDIAGQTFRLSDLMAELAEMKVGARIIVVDGAREFPLAGGQRIAPGLALVDAPAGSLLAFSAAPDALAIDGDGETSVYATALVTLMRQPGLDVDQIFRGVRVQVSDETGGAQTPWMQSTLDVEVVLFDTSSEPAHAAPQQAMPRVPARAQRTVTRTVLSGMQAEEAYYLVLEQDTLEGYQWYVELFPQSRYAAEIWDRIALRRESILWRRAIVLNTPRGYWNYLRRYPDGAHADEARWRLEALSASPEPPANYVVEAEPLPPGYYDEAMELVEIVPQGAPLPPPAFGIGSPMFIAPPPPRFVRPLRPHYRPPPPPRFVSRPPRLVVRPPRDIRRPVRWVRPPARPIRVGHPDVRRVRPGVRLPSSRVRAPRPAAAPGPSRVVPQPGGVTRPRDGAPRQPPSSARPGFAPGQPPRPVRPADRPTGRPAGRPADRAVGQPQRPQPLRPSAAPSQPSQPARPARPGRPAADRPADRPSSRPAGRPAGGPSGQPARQQTQPGQTTTRPARPSPQQGRPPSGRPVGQPQRPPAQPQRPAARPQPQPARPFSQPQRPAVQAPRPAAQPQRPAAQPQRPARPSAPSCPPGTRSVGGRCVR